MSWDVSSASSDGASGEKTSLPMAISTMVNSSAHARPQPTPDMTSQRRLQSSSVRGLRCTRSKGRYRVWPAQVSIRHVGSEVTVAPSRMNP